MDGDLAVIGVIDSDDFQHSAGPVWPDVQHAINALHVGLDGSSGQGTVDGMSDVCIGDAVAAGAVADLDRNSVSQ